MVFRISVCSDVMFSEEDNKLRHNSLIQKIKNLKDVVIKEEHKTYLTVVAKTDKKIKKILSQDFGGLGSCKKH